MCGYDEMNREMRVQAVRYFHFCSLQVIAAEALGGGRNVQLVNRYVSGWTGNGARARLRLY